MKLLVSGASGLLGRHLLGEIAEKHEVVALTRRETPPDTPGVDWVRQDLRDPLELGALPGRIDGVVHLAQSERYRDFPEGAEDIFGVNVHSTFRLLEYARAAGAGRFVLASTGGVYAPRATPIDEGAPLATPGPYFRSKRMAELLVDDYSEILSGAVLRFFFIYGPCLLYTSPSPRDGLLSRMPSSA